MATSDNIEQILGIFADDFMCGICLEIFNRENRNPKILPCGHSICHRCLIKCAEHNEAKKYECAEKDADDRFRCPLCNQKILLRPGDVDKLATNVDKMQLMEKIIANYAVAKTEVTKSKKMIHTCKKHVSEAAHICETCNEFMCAECMCLLSNPSGEHANHVVVQIEKSLASKIELLLKAKVSLAEAKQAIMKRESEADGDAKRDAVEVKTQIQKLATDLRKNIDEWELKSCEELDKVTCQRGKFRGASKNLHKQIDELEAKLEKEAEQLESKSILAHSSWLLNVTKDVTEIMKTYKPITINVKLEGSTKLTLGKVHIGLEQAARGQTVEDLCSRVDCLLLGGSQGKAKAATNDNDPKNDSGVGKSPAAAATNTQAKSSTPSTSKRDLPIAKQKVHMVPGARVTRGPDWPSGSQADGGAGGVGTVKEVRGDVVSVRWDRTGKTCHYYMEPGCYELRLA